MAVGDTVQPRRETEAQNGVHFLRPHGSQGEGRGLGSQMPSHTAATILASPSLSWVPRSLLRVAPCARPVLRSP